MKYLTLALLISTQAFAQIGDAFSKGYQDGTRVRENERREEELELKRQELELLRKSRTEDDAMSEYRREQVEERMREEQKREDLKLKLEALKQGYEITEDGELKKIAKPARRGASPKK